eukprot:COSAG02_NODE_52949_length_304_cov_126.331707_1_plen_57_part_10
MASSKLQLDPPTTSVGNRTARTKPLRDAERVRKRRRSKPRARDMMLSLHACALQSDK